MVARRTDLRRRDLQERREDDFRQGAHSDKGAPRSAWKDHRKIGALHLEQTVPLASIKCRLDPLAERLVVDRFFQIFPRDGSDPL